jgi:hypothetical protein
VSAAILHSEGEAVALVVAIDEALGYPRNGTETHSDVIEHPDGGEWAVYLDGLDLAAPWLADLLDGVEVVESLPTDWHADGAY